MSDKRRAPSFDVGDDYYSYEKDVEIWQIVTSLAAEKQGAELFLELGAEAKDFCRSIPIADLKADDGAQKVLARVKELYAKDKHTLMFQALDGFETFVRADDMDMNTFINEFDNRYLKVKTHCKVDYPVEALAYKLLKACRLKDEDAKLARATSELDFGKMKSHLKSVFGNSVIGSSNEVNSNVAIKVEPTFYGMASTSSSLNNDDDGHGVFYGHGYQRKKHHPRGNYRGKQSSSMNSQNYRKGNAIFDRFGKPLKCYRCHKYDHLSYDCPLKRYGGEDGDPENVLVTLFSKSASANQMSLFCQETLNCAVLDSGCIFSVCGEAWFQDMLGKLVATGAIKSAKAVQRVASTKEFKFGTGRSYKSKGVAQVPVYIGGEWTKIETDIIDLELPLLMGKTALIKAGLKWDFNEDHVIMCGRKVPLQTTSSDHVKICLLPSYSGESLQDVLLGISSDDWKLNEKAVRKLHLQFGHCRSDKLKQLLNDAGYCDTRLMNLVTDVVSGCQHCKMYKKTESRPVVGFALGKDFNDAVSMDLKKMAGHLVLHLIDHATRYSAAVVITSKRKEVIVEKIFTSWVALFGCPKKMLFDNGGEFCNDLMEEMTELLGTEVLTTGAESPWSNGITERHNAIIGHMVDKVLSEVSCSLNIALAWCVAAKNALNNVYGFSPNQLVFGRNPNFPVASEADLPALDGSTSSQLIADHLNALHAAREAFVASESSAKIKRALQRKTRTANAQEYTPGMKVYYKRQESTKWKGPASVIGNMNKQVLVKHGSYLYRVSPCHLTPVKDTPTLRSESSDTAHSSRLVDQSNEIPGFDSEEDTSSIDELPARDESGSSPDQDHEPEHAVEVEDSGRNNQEGGDLAEINHTVASGALPTVGSTVKYKCGDDAWKTARVLSRAGKANGRNKFWFNVQEPGSNPKSIDFQSLKTWKQAEEEVLLSLPTNSAEVLRAKQAEVDNLKAHGVFDEVSNTGQSYINVTWVLTEKNKDGGTIVKARLVAKGYEERWRSEDRKDSPTCLRESLHVVLGLAACKGWTIRCLDIKSAFLQGKPINRTLYLKPPVEAASGNTLWLLKKTIYGLKDAGRQWYLRVKQVLEDLCVKMSSYDEALFYWRDQNGDFGGVIALHVDDFFFAGTSEFYTQVICNVHNAFEISKEEEVSFNYLGLQLTQTSSGIVLDQRNYIDSIKMIEVDRTVNRQSALPKVVAEQLKSLIGQLSWVGKHSRPDILFDVCQLSVVCNSACYDDVLRANKCVKRLKSIDVGLKFSNLGDIKDCQLVSYSDASFANLANCASQGGSITFLCNKAGLVCPISWHSRKLKRVVKSTTSAETMALLDGIEDSLLISKLVDEICGNLKLPVVARVDCKNLKDSIYSSKTIEDKRLKIDVCTVRDYLRLGELNCVELVETKSQLADTLTKTGADATKLMEAVQGRLPIIYK